ncbi:MAG: alanyl-tRNA synthetase [Flammeovirgaceae bacterium]|jgi:alanyl-tRNA synthetase
MNAKEIRRKFLDFFSNKGHSIVSSAPIVVKNDPTLMFTNAGMNQFKDYFLGNKRAEYTKVADTQKCLRVSGKHNDLEEVGIDTYHHTMFEMLGNWSFGDYFKKEAIAWAWELLTEEYKLPKDKLYVTVFEGDKSEGLEPDNEAADFWKAHIEEDRIIYANKADNFWEMGEQGPCGPCSEIHVDLRSDEEIAKESGKDLVNKDHPQVVEIWNLVFIQFNRKADKSLEKLPNTHIDTGMGFERLAMAIQGKTSNYDTDVFQPMIQFIAKEYRKTEPDYEYNSYFQKTGFETKYEDGIVKAVPLTPKPFDVSSTFWRAQSDKARDYATKDIAIRVMADHIRAITFSIADGQLPSNNKAGYVIRRILRRAVRYGYTFLGLREPFLYKLIPILAEQFDEVFPEVVGQLEFIQNVVKKEESSFLSTLAKGLDMLNRVMSSYRLKEPPEEAIRQKNVGGSQSIDMSKVRESWIIDGRVVFELYDTFGFPLDLTELIARENSFTLDKAGFESAMKIQKDRSRKDADSEKGDWIEVSEGEETDFIGYDFTETNAKILRYREIQEKKKTFFQIVLDKTPFYAESGGQVGDTGLLISESEKVPVIDTQKENDLIIHIVSKLPQDLSADFRAEVNTNRRNSIANNHSATHLLHAALREVLGEHVAQKGSLVNDKSLRFDFSHFQGMTDEEVAKVEKIANQKIRENIELQESRNVPIEKAKDMGAMALFGEKYGDYVRVITFDKDYSVELCGGIHVPATGKIGLLKITGESSVAAGVRRIEAITANEAEAFVDKQIDLLDQIKTLFKNPKDVVKTAEKLIQEKSELEKQIANYQNKEVELVKNTLVDSVENRDGVNFIAQKVSVPNADSLKNLAFSIKNKIDNLFMVLAADVAGKPQVAIMISDNLVTEKGYHAGNFVRELAKEIKGGGGGQPFFATAGGKDLGGLSKVVEKAQELV